MKPNLKELNLEKLKKIAAKTPRIRVKLTRKHWIFIGCAVVVLVLSLIHISSRRRADILRGPAHSRRRSAERSEVTFSFRYVFGPERHFP